MSSPEAIKKGTNQNSGVRRVKTMELILSVTVAKVWPGAITVGLPDWSERVSRCSSLMLRILDIRIRIAERSQVGGARARVQFCQQRIIQLFGLQLRDVAHRVVGVTENDSLCGADLLASRLNFAVAHFAAILLRIDFGFVDALHAVGALFHDAAATNRDVGITLQLEAGRGPIRVQEKIESPHFVRAVVGTI